MISSRPGQTPAHQADVAELEALRTRVAELEGTVASLEAANRELSAAAALVPAIFDAVPYIVTVNDVAEARLLAINPAGTRVTGRPVAEWIGKTSEELFPPEMAREVRRCIAECAATQTVSSVEERLQVDAEEFWMQTLYIPVVGPTGTVDRVVTSSFDITARKRQEQSERTQQELVIEQQSAALAELSTPLLTIKAGVVVMPLVGAIDSRRAVQILDTLLSGIADTRARYAILDITGVTVVDTQVASALIRAAQAARLLGTQVILTGIRPEVAQTLIGLGTDLSSVLTQGNLQSGIALALGGSLSGA